VKEKRKYVYCTQSKSNERKDNNKKCLPIWKGILNYLMFSWNALCATNISKKKVLAALDTLLPLLISARFAGRFHDQK
jgi:hypothetical protein